MIILPDLLVHCWLIVCFESMKKAIIYSATNSINSDFIGKSQTNIGFCLLLI